MCRYRGSIAIRAGEVDAVSGDDRRAVALGQINAPALILLSQVRDGLAGCKR